MSSCFNHRGQSIPSDIPATEFARICVSALKSLLWQVNHVDELTRTIVAHLNRSQLVLGKNWQWEFAVVIEWEVMGGNAARINMSVQEQRYNWTMAECEEQFFKIIGKVAEIWDRIPKSGFATYRGARWATPSEALEAGYIGALGNGDSFIIAGNRAENQFLRLPPDETIRHAIVCGPTGSGKTKGIFSPNLLERLESSAIVTEATGGKGIASLFQTTSGYRKEVGGHEIFYFNPNSRQSYQINPLDFVHSYRQARRVVEIIMQSTTSRTHRADQSWDNSERMLLTSLVLHATSQRGEGQCNLSWCLDVMEEGYGAVTEILNDSPVRDARRAYAKFINLTTEPFRNLVANGIMSRLDIWNQPLIRKLTETTTIPFEELKAKLWTIYLAVPADNEELKPLAALVLNFLIEYATTSQFQKPIMLLLDEFTNYGRVNGLPAKLTIMRHDRIPAVLGVQDIVQLELLYDKHAKLFVSQPATRIFFKPNDVDDAKKISDMLGIAIEELDRVSSGGQIQPNEKKEPLLSVTDLLNLGAIGEASSARSKAIALLPRTRPLLVDVFQWTDYANETNTERFPPVDIPTLEVDENLEQMAPGDQGPRMRGAVGQPTETDKNEKFGGW